MMKYTSLFFIIGLMTFCFKEISNLNSSINKSYNLCLKLNKEVPSLKLDCVDLMKRHIEETLTQENIKEEKVELNFLFDQQEKKEENFLFEKENQRLFDDEEIKKPDESSKRPIEIKSFKDLNINLENFIEEKDSKNTKKEMDINDLIQSHRNKKEKEREKERESLKIKEKFTKVNYSNNINEINSKENLNVFIYYL